MINPIHAFIKSQQAFLLKTDLTLKISVIAGSVMAGLVSPLLDSSTEDRLKKSGKVHLPYPQLFSLILVAYLCGSTAIGMGSLNFKFS